MKRVLAWAMFLSFALLPAGAALLLSWQEATAQSDPKKTIIDVLRQDDIVVKPGGGGGKAFTKGDRLVWYKDNMELKPGDPYSFRDDFQGKIKYFHIADPNTDPNDAKEAKSITFVVSEAGIDTKVTLKRTWLNNFKWKNSRGLDFEECNHDSNQPDHCHEGGLPPFLLGILQGNIEGELTDGTKVSDVTYIHLQGAK